MVDKTLPPSTNPNLQLNIHPPPPPHSTAGSNSNIPFTPRSSTFPDDLSSEDPDIDVFEPTPISSPGGPHYDDLPPSYDEAQQQALEDARAGRTPPNPNDIEIHRLVLNDTQYPYMAPPGPETQRTRVSGNLLDNPHAYEFEPENRRNSRGLGTSIPVQQVEGVEHIPVANMPLNTLPTNNIPVGHISSSAGATRVVPNPTAVLLSRALEFTKHEPDADARFAPRLTRVVAVPQQRLPSLRPVEGRGSRHRHRGHGRRERRGGGPTAFPPWAPTAREMHRMPGQWPDTSTESLPELTEEPVQFLRAYAKALHAHSIRPAEFTEFLDGLNALCLATGTTAQQLTRPDAELDEGSSLIQNYVASTNESFFAPRGLKVSLRSLSSLTTALQIPEDRGQRAGAVASVLDETSTAEQRAGSLFPWIERLENNVPEPTSQMLVLREMSERIHCQAYPQSQSQFQPEPHPISQNQDTGVIRDNAPPSGPEKPREEDQTVEDPPHSIPTPPPGPIPGSFPSFGPQFPFGPGHGSRRGGPPFGPGNWGHWTQNQANWAGPWGNHRERGRGWGMGRVPGAWPPPHRGRRGCGAPNPRAAAPPFPRPGETNSWAAWGESIGKWGEEFGKHMAEWGEQFGKKAEDWGHGVERRAGSWGEEIERRATGFSGNPNNIGNDVGADTRARETGVHVGEEGSKAKEISKNTSKDEAKGEHDDNSDTESISSSSDSSDSSDSDSDSDSDSGRDPHPNPEPEPLYPDPESIFLARIREINLLASAATAKGKKSPLLISRERDAAIARASADKTALELKIAQKREKATRKMHLKECKRESKAEAKRVKNELKELGVGKKEIKKEYRTMKREKMREHRVLKREAKREWKERAWERREERRKLRRARFGGEGERMGFGMVGRGRERGAEREERMVWVVVENLVA